MGVAVTLSSESMYSMMTSWLPSATSAGHVAHRDKGATAGRALGQLFVSRVSSLLDCVLVSDWRSGISSIVYPLNGRAPADVSLSMRPHISSRNGGLPRSQGLSDGAYGGSTGEMAGC
jgi:hypothetical protein